jgi:hypothetical protein
MPGFNIGKVTDSNQPNSKANYYYTYTWEVQELFEVTSASKDVPVVRLRDATLPTFSSSVDKYLASSVEYKWAKGVMWDDVKLVWYDSEGFLDVVEGWRKTIWTAEGGLKPGASYKKRSKIRTFLPDGSAGVAWTLFNSWPSQIRSGELTYTNSDVKTVEVTVTYDWAEGAAG